MQELFKSPKHFFPFARSIFVPKSSGFLVCRFSWFAGFPDLQVFLLSKCPYARTTPKFFPICLDHSCFQSPLVFMVCPDACSTPKLFPICSIHFCSQSPLVFLVSKLPYAYARGSPSLATPKFFFPLALPTLGYQSFVSLSCKFSRSLQVC